MAQLQYTDPVNYNSERPRVGFFSLKNDGDEAIVKFLHSSTADFDIVSMHRIMIDGKERKVNCLRLPTESLDKCPLCAAGNQASKRVFIHLLQYTTDDNGNVMSEPLVWERSMKYATELKALIEEYGDLKDCVFKIHRNGFAGSMDTTYNIMYCAPSKYPVAKYTCDDEAFDGYSACGTIVWDKPANDLQYYVDNGTLPSQQKAEVEDELGLSSDEPLVKAATKAARTAAVADEDDAPAVTRPSRYY